MVGPRDNLVYGQNNFVRFGVGSDEPSNQDHGQVHKASPTIFKPPLPPPLLPPPPPDIYYANIYLVPHVYSSFLLTPYLSI